MPKPTSRFCPLCLLALLGIVVLLGVPDLAVKSTPLGKFSLLLLWIPLISALLRQTLLRVTQPVRRQPEKRAGR